MRVLQCQGYTTIDEFDKFSRSKSGFGYITADIAVSLAQNEISINLITQSNITNGFKYQKVNILRRFWLDIFIHVRIRHFREAINVIIKDKIAIQRVPNILLYNLSMGYFEKVLATNNFDIIHIHGLGYYTLPIIEICKQRNLAYIVTLHGLNSFSEKVQVSASAKLNEKRFLLEAYENSIPVSVISTGIRKQILQYLQVTETDNFEVILNGVKIRGNGESQGVNIRRDYKVPDNHVILVCVGNISENKNQVGIIKALDYLPNQIKNRITLFLIGRYDDNSEKEIQNLKCSSRVVLCGHIDREKVRYYYDQADYNIVASFSEGFGLPIIEGYTYGLPCIAFSDIDAIQDLYHCDAMLLIEKRTVHAFAEAIANMILKDWNRDFIRMYSANFSVDRMAIEYINYYKRVLENHNLHM